MPDRVEQAVRAKHQTEMDVGGRGLVVNRGHEPREQETGRGHVMAAGHPATVHQPLPVDIVEPLRDKMSPMPWASKMSTPPTVPSAHTVYSPRNSSEENDLVGQPPHR